MEETKEAEAHKFDDVKSTKRKSANTAKQPPQKRKPLIRKSKPVTNALRNLLPLADERE